MLITFFYIADSILYTIIFVMTIYLLVFAIACMKKQKGKYPKSAKQRRFIVLIPPKSVFSKQTYPESLFQVREYEDLSMTVNELSEKDFDIIIILGQTIGTSATLIEDINNAADNGIRAMQLHPIANLLPTTHERKKAKQREIQNSLFNAGHVSLGLSANLDPTDIAINFRWFKKHLKSNHTLLERKLIKNGHFIGYLDYAIVRTEQPRPMHRSVWKWKELVNIPIALVEGNGIFLDKIFQKLLFPWKVLLGLTLAACLTTTIIEWNRSLGWWFILFIQMLAYSFATPDYLVKKKRN